MLIVVPKISQLYSTSLSFSCAFAVFYSIVTVGGAFFLAYRAFAPTKEKAPISYGKPNGAVKTLLLILIGFGGSIVANFVTSILRGFAEAFGVYSAYSAIEDPSNTMDIILMFFASAIVPPLIEEFGARGLMMHSLKKYGNGFAILGSAFVFAVLHGNAVQIPFAFICALFIGYAVIATNSIWTGIIIHALVNSLSCVSSVLMYYFDEHTANLFFYVISGVGFFAGIIALIIYTQKYKDEGILRDRGEATELSLGTRFGKFISSPLMVVGVILFVIQAISTLTTTPTTY
jgi:membrane protease YdiL (CAAX protease family)